MEVLSPPTKDPIEAANPCMGIWSYFIQISGGTQVFLPIITWFESREKWASKEASAFVWKGSF